MTPEAVTVIYWFLQNPETNHVSREISEDLCLSKSGARKDSGMVPVRVEITAPTVMELIEKFTETGSLSWGPAFELLPEEKEALSEVQ